MWTIENLHAGFDKMVSARDKKPSGMELVPLSTQSTSSAASEISISNANQIKQLAHKIKWLQIIKKCAAEKISVEIYAKNMKNTSGQVENMKPIEFKFLKCMQKSLLEKSMVQNVPVEKLIKDYAKQLNQEKALLDNKSLNLKCVVVSARKEETPEKKKDIEVREGFVTQGKDAVAQCVQKEQTEMTRSEKENFVSYEDMDKVQDSKYVTAEESISDGEDVEKEQDLAYLPQPKHILYVPGKIMMDWRWKMGIGAGLQNHGNTCFMNATLQCLTYTAPFVNYLIYDNHKESCKLEGFCMSCAMQDHVLRCMTNSGKAIDTKPFVDNLESIAKHMTFGEQEDAHEFLRYALDAMQKFSLDGRKNLDPLSKETTVINQIFGGYLRNQIVCVKCRAVKIKFEHFMDLSLNINDITTLKEAADKFVAPERLEDYECSSCKEKASIWKRFAIETSPNILTLQLNQFGGPYGRKLKHKVEFPEQLDIRPFMIGEDGEPVMYKLYAMLVHAGATCNSGHYFACVKNSQQKWYMMNDQRVHELSSELWPHLRPYLLFYQKEETS